MNNRKKISHHSQVNPWHSLLWIWFLWTGWTGFPLKANANELGFKQYRENVLKQIEENKQALLKNPSDANIHFQLGLSYLALGLHEKEIAEYLEAIRLKPDFAEAHFNLAQAYDLLGEGAPSIRHMLRARQIYSAHRNHRGIRASQRHLRTLYEKYGPQPEDMIRPR